MSKFTAEGVHMSSRLDLAAGGLAVIREIQRLPRVPEWATTPELRQRLLEAEAAVRDDLDAYRTAYIHGVLTSPTKNFIAVGTDIHHVRKLAGRWKIIERCITDDVSYP